MIPTTDLSDAYPDAQVVAPGFHSFGGRIEFSGAIATVRCFEDNSLVREALEESGKGRVLVVDGGGSMACALLGDRLGQMGHDNGWAGVVVNGCVRDVVELSGIDIGVRALASHPRRSVKRGMGERDVGLDFGGVIFSPGDWLYADADGVVVLAEPAEPQEPSQ